MTDTPAVTALHELTVEYLKTRKQFGVPIGSFQVLQHRAVDMLTALEQARSMAYFATMMAGEPDDRWATIAQTVPGFAGWFWEGTTLVLMLVDTAQRDAAVAALAGRSPSTITGADAVAISYPSFFETLDRLVAPQDRRGAR